MVEDKFEPKKLNSRELSRLPFKQKVIYYKTRYSYLALRAWNKVHLSLSTYFVLSGALYTACGMMLHFVGENQVYQFLCNVSCDGIAGPEILMYDKDVCYKAAVNLTILDEAGSAADSLYAALSDSSDNVECNSVIAASEDPLETMTLMYNSPLWLTSSCFDLHCGVLKMAYSHPDLYDVSGTCTNTRNQKPAADASVCVCSSVGNPARKTTPPLSDAFNPDNGGAGPTIGDDIWTLCNLDEQTMSPTEAPTEAPTAAATIPSSRRLYDGVEGAESSVELWEPLDSGEGSLATPQAAADTRREVEVSAGGDILPNRAWDRMANEEYDRATGRALQATDPPTSFPTNYGTDPWSPCTGLQQCLPGVKTRTVTCLDGEGACALPPPASEARCTVDHCSNCRVVLSLTLVAISYYIQGGVALLVFLVFAIFGSRTEEKREDMMVRPHICMRPLGFICKNLPPLVRTLVFVNFCQLAYLVIQTWVPTDVFSLTPDCNNSIWLRVLTSTAAGIWTFQFIFGLAAKAFCRQEPWLYQPLRPGLLKPIWKILGLLGP